MNFLDAAFEVLKKAGAPLHYAEITRRALLASILDTKGQTPEATMAARLYVDTKRPDSRFRRVSRNIFALAEAPSSEISERVNAINRHVRDELMKRLLQMPPERFEVLIGELLLALGFEEETLEVTSYGGDGGIDVRGVLNAGNITEIKAAVQVKRWRNNVQAPIVQGLRGSLTVHEQGIIITTSKFSKGAQQEAEAPGKMRISLVDGDQLLSLLIKHKIGVKSDQHVVYTLDEDWWGGIISAGDGGNDIVAPAPTTLKSVSYPLAIQAQVHGQVFQALLLGPTGIVQYNNEEYSSPSRAGQVVTGWKSCNGWGLWHYRDPLSGEWRAIDELRHSPS